MVKAGMMGDQAQLLTQRATTPSSSSSASQASANSVTGAISPLHLQSPAATVDHLLLSPRARVAVISPDEGLSASAYAAARPHWQVAAWVPDMKTLLRGQNYHELNNLTFDKQPSLGKKLAQHPDAIIAVGWAHCLNQPHALGAHLRQLLSYLPAQGQLLLQDIGLPNDPDQFVLLDIATQDVADALQHFAQSARPSLPSPLRGFFLEAQPAPRANVQRFRLQLKWATEFLQRWRLGVSMDTPVELTTLSVEQWGLLAEQCGGRVLYRAPHPVTETVQRKLEKTFQFYNEQGKPLSLPPASFTLVIEKGNEQQPTRVREERPSTTPPRDLSLKKHIDPRTKKAIDWIDVSKTQDDLLVWRKDDNGRIRVWLRAGVSRPLLNCVARGTPNLDGRQWSGFVIEPLSVMSMDSKLEQSLIADAVTSLSAIPAESVGMAQIGAQYYSAPTYVDQRVRGLLVEVKQALPIDVPLQTDGTRLVELLADDVLRALSRGLLADSKLEILIGTLLQNLGLRPPLSNMLDDQTMKRISTKLRRPSEMKMYKTLRENESLIPYLADEGVGEMRCMRSLFVSEQTGPMGARPITAVELDFMLPTNLSSNLAVCIPLLKNPLGGFVMGAEARNVPMPDRVGGDEELVSLPSFRLPQSVTTVDEARRFLAGILECNPDDLTPFGTSVFLQPHLSPERVYSFLVHAPDRGYRWDRFVKPRGSLQRIVEKPVEKTTAGIEMKAQRDLGEWYMGFTPDLMSDMTKRVKAEPAPAVEVARNDNRVLAPQPD